MNTKAIAFTASEQTLVKTSGADAYASNTVGYIEATFDLDTNWDGFDSVRAVWKSQYYTISAVLDAYGKCLVPAEVKYYKSKVFVNLVGSNVEDDVLVDRLTTYPVLAFTIDAEAEVEGTETTDITPSQFEQFVDQVEGYAESAAEDAQSIAESAAQIEQNAEDIADLKEEINDKPNWTVGSAEQIVSDEASQTDVTPYTFRRSGGGLIPFNFTREELSKVVGGTVAWNQLISPSGYNTQTVNGVTMTKNDDGSVMFSGTATADASFSLLNTRNNPLVKGRVYYIHNCPENGGRTTYYGGVAGLRYDFGDGAIFKHSYDWGTTDVRLDVASGATINGTVYPQYIDLTAMFGSTIADYIYSLEQATAGAGVAWFKKLFPKPYYAYNAGELMSVNTSAHNTVGFNQWDEEWELGTLDNSGNDYASTTRIRSKGYTSVLPSTTYYLKSSMSMQLFYYDADKAFISAQFKTDVTFTTPSNAYYLRFAFNSSYGTTYNNDICINLSKTTGTPKNGDYVPYQKHTYALDSTKTLRGRFYLDSNNQLRADGDVYPPSGEVERTYGVVDLGTLTYIAPSSTGRTSATLGAKAPTASTNVSDLVCSKYVAITTRNWYDSAKEGIAICGAGYGTAGNVGIVDSSFIGKTAEEVKALLSGVYLVYPLATPTTETADPYTAVQICDSDGTEEFVDALVASGDRDVAIPAGTETVYYEDMAGKLAELPPIPSAPSANGTYTLQAVVSSGAVTYQWTS